MVLTEFSNFPEGFGGHMCIIDNDTFLNYILVFEVYWDISVNMVISVLIIIRQYVLSLKSKSFNHNDFIFLPVTK